MDDLATPTGRELSSVPWISTMKKHMPMPLTQVCPKYSYTATENHVCATARRVDQARCLCPSAIPLRAVVYEPRSSCPTELPQPQAPLRGPARRVCALLAALHGLPPQSASAAFW